MTYKPDIVITHYPCSDGATAEAIIRNYYEDDLDTIEFIRGDYADKEIDALIDRVRGKHVLMADFSYKSKDLQGLMSSSESIVILDHHVTAEKELENFKMKELDSVDNIDSILEDQKCIAFFDMEECGASMTWKFFYPDQPIPYFVERIKDIDLGRRKMDRANDFLWFSRSIELTGEAYLEYLFAKEKDFVPLFDMGSAVASYVNVATKRTVESAIEGEYEGFTFKFVVSDYAFVSEVSNGFVAEDFDLGITGYFTKQGFGLSIRSKKGVDCSILAKALGGGGHKQASGVNITYEDLPEFIDAMQEAIVWK